MLQITIPEREFFDENTSLFINYKEEVIQLEHSLVSISKWESKWRKPYLGQTERTDAEIIDYIKCMTITQNVNPKTYLNLTNDIYKQIDDYINEPMTATWFTEQPNAPKSKEIITAEIIYYWMIAQTIPLECQKWHLNRLLTLIRVCSIKNQPPKKRGQKDMLSHRNALNQARRTQNNTKG